MHSIKTQVEYGCSTSLDYMKQNPVMNQAGIVPLSTRYFYRSNSLPPFHQQEEKNTQASSDLPPPGQINQRSKSPARSVTDEDSYLELSQYRRSQDKSSSYTDLESNGKERDKCLLLKKNPVKEKKKVHTNNEDPENTSTPKMPQVRGNGQSRQENPTSVGAIKKKDHDKGRPETAPRNDLRETHRSKISNYQNRRARSHQSRDRYSHGTRSRDGNSYDIRSRDRRSPRDQFSDRRPQKGRSDSHRYPEQDFEYNRNSNKSYRRDRLYDNRSPARDLSSQSQRGVSQRGSSLENRSAYGMNQNFNLPHHRSKDENYSLEGQRSMYRSSNCNCNRRCDQDSSVQYLRYAGSTASIHDRAGRWVSARKRGRDKKNQSKDGYKDLTEQQKVFGAMATIFRKMGARK